MTKSSTAAEYVALSETVSEILLIKDLLINFKYIEVHYHIVNENYEKGLIEIVKVSSEKNIADILTKALGRVRFEKLRSLLNLI